MKATFTALLLLCVTVGGAQTLTSSELPIIIINTNGATIDEEDKVQVDFTVIDNGHGQLNQITDSPSYDGHCGLEFRGNSTLDADKKSYSLELWTAAGADTSASLLGLPKEEDWILHASTFDKSLLRNPLSFHLWERMGHYASRSRFCEVVIDGDYRGVYHLMEKLKRDKKRLDIAKLDSDDNAGDSLTGGYMLRLDWNEGDAPGFSSNYPTVWDDPLFLQYHYPKGDRITPQQINYITSYVDSFETALFSPSLTHPAGKPYHNFADLTTFADLLILNELSRSVDGYKLSTYLYKDRGGKLSAGPVWDFDNAYNNADYCGCSSISGWTYQQQDPGCDDLNYMPLWWDRLMSDPVFTNHLRCRWEEARSTFLHPDSVTDWIDEQLPAFDAAKDRNFNRWNHLGVNLFDQPEPIPATHSAEIAVLKDWLRDRIAWMDANLPGTCSDDVLGVAPGPAAQDLVLYPNPTTGQFRADWHTPIDGQLTLMDMAGKSIYDAQCLACTGGRFNLEGLDPGIYFLRVVSQDTIWTGEVVKLD